MVAAIGAGVAARRMRRIKARREAARSNDESLAIRPSISTSGSRGSASPIEGGWGKGLLAIGSSIIGIGFRVITLGVVLWAGLGVVRWTFSLAAGEAAAIGRGAKQIQEGASTLVA